MMRVVAFLLALGLTSPAQAQSYPSRPITLVLALPAGGAVDALGRILAEHMRVTLGQPIIIENMGGAGGTLSIARIVRAAPDGYTLGMGTLGQYVISAAVYTLPFDMQQDLTPIVLLPSVPYWMAARKDLPANNLKELEAWLKANPGKGSAASTGTASVARFCGMGFEARTGTKLNYVPYRGGAPAIQDLVAGQIDLDCDLAANSLSQKRAGNLKVLAVMSPRRWAAAPDVPTSDESGYSGLHYGTWHGFWGPKGTPPEIVDRISKAAHAAMADPEVQKRIAALGMDLPPPEHKTPAAFAAFYKAEAEKWYPIVKAAGVKAE